MNVKSSSSNIVPTVPASEYIVNMNDIAMKTKVLTSLDAETEETFTASQRKALFRTLTQNIRTKGKGALNIRKYIVDKLNSMMTGDKDTWLISKFLDELRSLIAKARKVFGEILTLIWAIVNQCFKWPNITPSGQTVHRWDYQKISKNMSDSLL